MTFFVEVVNIDCSLVFACGVLHIDVSVVEIGSDGGMYKLLSATRKIDAIGSAVADFRVGNSRINMLKYKPIEGMVVYAAVGHCKHRQVFFALALYI